MAVGDRIKRARNLRGMTQKELGIAIGFEEKSVSFLRTKLASRSFSQ